MNTAEAVRMICMLEEIAEKQPSAELHAGIAAVLGHIRSCVPADQAASFDRYCERREYLEFVERMDSASESAV